jgi:glutathione reductase (NADPH)
MDFDYDLFVIGGGSGGVRAARVASEHGAKVGLAESSRMGGTCVIRGCVPKKLMVFASHYPEEFRHASGYGWDVSWGDFDWDRFRDKLAGELSRLEQVYRDNLTKAGVTILDARARVEGPHEVSLAGGERLRARHILIATGGHPVLPPQVENAGCGITSDDVFGLERQPKRLLIVGGGYIACEFACIFNGLGTEVIQWHRGKSILRGFDDEARGLISELIQEHGVDLDLETDVEKVERLDDGTIRVRASSGREIEVDEVLMATGRKPNTQDLGLEEAGVTLGEKGEVVVDEWSQSSVKSIWAVGDVTNRIALTPVAIREGHAFADTVFGGNRRTMDHECVPSAIFTQPEFGTVGLTEEEAVERHSIEVYCTSFRPMQHAFVGRQERVLFKLVVDADTRRVLGCHIVGQYAGELIQLAGVAVKMGATKEDFDRTVAVHPTVSEEIVTMREPTRTA